MSRQDDIYQAVTQFAKTPDLYGFMQWLPETVPMLLKHMLSEIDAHEASIWIIDDEKEQLVICYNTEELARHFSQPLDTGFVSKAYREERPVHHKGIYRYHEGSGLIDSEHAQNTQHQISVPLYLFGKLCGSLSVVQLSSDFHSEPREDVPWGFKDEAVTLLAAAAVVVAENIESKWNDQ